MKKDRAIGAVLLVALAVLVGVSLRQTSGPRRSMLVIVESRPRAVMGTNCLLRVVCSHRDASKAEDALREAEATLRAIEARMSSWLADSEISRLNSAAVGKQVTLSPDVVELLRAAREATEQTAGAFDVTCGPLVQLWRGGGQAGRLPGQSELDAARATSNWNLVELHEGGATKRHGDARVDLGGIAKGYAIDRATEVLQQAGLDGGLVDVGGDLKCSGRPPLGEAWPVEVQNPFGPGALIDLRIPGGAVATSGGYERFVEISGRRYSHVIDPRTGRPADTASSVTVIAADALTADTWATALCVLGPAGFDKLPDGVEALVITGTAEDYHVESTPGCAGLIAGIRE